MLPLLGIAITDGNAASYSILEHAQDSVKSWRLAGVVVVIFPQGEQGFVHAIVKGVKCSFSPPRRLPNVVRVRVDVGLVPEAGCVVMCLRD